MKRKLLIVMIAVLIAAGFLGAYRRSMAQLGEREYIQQTGHWVTGDFLNTYHSVLDPEKIYGYPITDAFLNPSTGVQVQYFTKAYFVLHPENPPELRVQRAPLGEFLYKPGPVLSIPPGHPACRYFSETSHQVCYAFLEYFNQNGGLAQFGYPYSEIEMHDGHMVQYFQRAVFEWHPDLQAGQKVILADIGTEYFEARNEDPNKRLPVLDGNILQTILSLQVSAFPAHAVVPAGGEQTVYVIVQDQRLMGVEGAAVSVKIRYPSGKETSQTLPPTNSAGITNFTFPVEDSTIGIVQISIDASLDKFQTHTVNSFRIWY